MLAQSFMTADQLGITEPQRDALQKTLVLLETGKLRHVLPGDNDHDRPISFSGQFNMNQWRGENDCGTIACIGGTAQIVGNLEEDELRRASSFGSALNLLFYPDIALNKWREIDEFQAATALRSYLTTGDPKWSEAVS